MPSPDPIHTDLMRTDLIRTEGDDETISSQAKKTSQAKKESNRNSRDHNRNQQRR
jgi:hypothetical protein